MTQLPVLLPPPLLLLPVLLPPPLLPFRARLVYRRSDCEELWFDFADRAKTVLLPVISDGRLVICEWAIVVAKGNCPKPAGVNKRV